jgi:hypothetical protein
MEDRISETPLDSSPNICLEELKSRNIGDIV